MFFKMQGFDFAQI